MIAHVQRSATHAFNGPQAKIAACEPAYLPLPALSGAALSDSIALLAIAFANQEITETAFASTAVAGHSKEREFQLARVKEQQDKQLKIDHGRGLFGSLFKLLSDAFKNVLKFDPAGFLKDAGHDLEPLLTSKALWSDLQAIGKSIAKIAVAVGAAALAGLSFGTASVPAIVIAALILSTSSAIVGESKCLDGLLGEGWSDRIAAGLGAACVLVTGGASGLSIASAATQLDVAASGVAAGAKILEGLGGSQASRLGYVSALSKVDEMAAQASCDKENKGSQWAVEQMQEVVSHLVRSREILVEVVSANTENGRAATRAWS